jgi:hypothetical protein
MHPRELREDLATCAYIQLLAAHCGNPAALKLPLSDPGRHHLRQSSRDCPKKKRTRETMSNRDAL